MKNTFKLFGIIAFMAVIGFSFSACGDSKDDGNSSDPLKGTWTGQVEGATMKLVAADGKFEVEQNGNPSGFRGTYTVSGNTVSITFTEVNTGTWITYDDAKEAGTDGLPPKNIDGTINGNNLKLEAGELVLDFTKI